LGAVQADHTIPTTGKDTGRETGISILPVTIITFLSTVLAHGEIESSDRITAERHFAGFGALVAVLFITIIALLALFDLAVATTGLGLSNHDLLTGTASQSRHSDQKCTRIPAHWRPPRSHQPS